MWLVSHRLRDLPLEAPVGESVIAPMAIEGLPAGITALGRRWRRKVEFHMTVLGATVIWETGNGDPGIWEVVEALVGGRMVGPIYASRDLRRVRDCEKPGLETLVVMVRCRALRPLYKELSRELNVSLTPPPAHVTLYSTDPKKGIGINDRRQLRERAPALGEEDREEVRRAMRFDEVFDGAR